MHELITHRAYGKQIDAICFVACARSRLIYKQPFETRSTQKPRLFFFLSHAGPSFLTLTLVRFGCTLSGEIGRIVRNKQMEQIGFWYLCVMVCLEL